MSKLKIGIGQIIGASVVLAVIVFILLISAVDDGGRLARQVKAGNEHNVSGYAWSDNIGWISFNCLDAGTCGTVNYGVNIAANGNMSGYAWSDNIGWVSFNESDLSDCPVPNGDGECKAKLTGNYLSGWAKALAGEEAADGWDGWISLGTQIGETVDYGVDLVGNNLEGYAWGDEVVGWIKFNPVYGGGVAFTGEAAEIMSFAVSTVSTGSNPKASWSAENANECKGDWTTGNVCSSSEECASVTNLVINQPVPAGGATYVLTCYGSGGNDTKSVTPPAYFEFVGDPLEVVAVFAGGGATTTPTNITVVSMNGFDDDIILSTNLNSLPADSTATYSDSVLLFSEYGSGSELEIYIPEPISGAYIIKVLGNDEISREIEITINATGIAPVFEEI